MKKIFLSFAALAVLVSCVEENRPEPEQTTDNIVTIKAVAGETKTTLDGTDVVWEEGDEIDVLFYVNNGYTSVNFKTELKGTNSTADFTGSLVDVDLEKAEETVNLLYPAGIYSQADGIQFTVPAEQDGTVSFGDNLSYASLTKTAIAAGGAEATFTNVLSLIRITVPTGVKTLTLTANRYLSGTSQYRFNGGQLVLQLTNQASANNKVVLSSEGGLDETKTYDVLVYPGAVKTLTLELLGTDGAIYSKTLSNTEDEDVFTFEAGKYHGLNVADIFQWNTETALVASPLGGELEIVASTTADYEYSVVITNADDSGTPDWISLQAQAVKSFHKETITLNVEANTSDNTREAKVTVSYGEGKSQVFTVKQAAIFLDFVYVDPDADEPEPIQWQETFGVYESEDDAINKNNAKGTFTNVFTISVSDVFSNGAYKIENLFADSNGGTTYYADYSDSELIIYTSSAKASDRKYYFKSDEVILTYDADNKTFTAKSAAIPAGTNYLFTGFSNKDCYIGGYSVAVKVEEEPEESQDPYVGTWNGSGRHSSMSNFSETFEIKSNDDDKGDYVITGLFNLYGQGGGTYYANYSEGVLTILAANSSNSNIGGGLSSDIQMTYSDGTLTLPSDTSVNQYAVVNSYTATKQ